MKTKYNGYTCIKCKKSKYYKDYVYGMSGNALVCKECFEEANK